MGWCAVSRRTTYAMRELHGSRGSRRSLLRGRRAREVSERRWILVMAALGRGLLCAASRFVVVLLGRPVNGSEFSWAVAQRVALTRVCRPNATGCPGALPIRPALRPPEGGSRFGTTGSLSVTDQGRGKSADQCCSADAKKEFPAQLIVLDPVSGVGPGAIWVSVWAERPRSTRG